MSMNELNTTARDLMSVRAMIEELEAEAQALTDKLKAAGRAWAAVGLIPSPSRPTMPTSTASTAARPPPPAFFSAYEKGPYPERRHS